MPIKLTSDVWTADDEVRSAKELGGKRLDAIAYRINSGDHPKSVYLAQLNHPVNDKRTGKR